MDEALTEPSLTLAIALAAGVVAQWLARLTKIPAIILLLAVGVALGPEGWGWLQTGALGHGLFGVVDFAVAVILFEGGLNLEVRRLRREERSIRQLVTLGALVTLFGGTLAARLWLDWPWASAFLFGALVVVTGPTVVGPLLRDLRLRPRVQTILEAEGVLIDSIGALLAVLVLQVTLAPGALGFATELGDLVLRLAFGIASGLLAGLIMAGLLRLEDLVHGFENILTLALVVLVFHVCDHVLSQSGLLAVTIAGIVVGNLETPVDRDLREFKDQLSVLLIGVIFVLLAADVGLTAVAGLGWAGVGVLATLVLAVRPLGAWASTRGSGLSVAERTFIAAIAPRGIVAAAIASLTAVVLDARGIAGAAELRAMVFLVIAGTVVSAGVLAWPMAALLGLRLPRRDRVAILGVQGLGLALGGVLREGGVPVVFLEADPKRCRAAEKAGFPVVFGDALQDRTLLRAQAPLVSTAIGLTFNDHLNSLFVGHAMGRFGVARGLVSVDSLGDAGPPEHVGRQRARVLFDGPHDQERWDVRWRHGWVAVERFEFQPEAALGPDATPAAAGREFWQADHAVLLALWRGDRVTPMVYEEKVKTGDRASVAVYTPDRAAAVAALRSLGWIEVPPAPSPAETLRPEAGNAQAASRPSGSIS